MVLDSLALMVWDSLALMVWDSLAVVAWNSLAVVFRDYLALDHKLTIVHSLKYFYLVVLNFMPLIPSLDFVCRFDENAKDVFFYTSCELFH